MSIRIQPCRSKCDTAPAALGIHKSIIMTKNRISYVIDHVQASYPCTMNSIVNWCLEQGLEDACGPAITSMLMDKIIEICILDGDLIVDPA